jgi:hypothetical protein
MSLDVTPYKRYFGGIIQKQNLTPNVRETPNFLNLCVNIPLKEHPGNTAKVEIILGLSHDSTCWIVCEFNVVTANPFVVLWGDDLLSHYGKRRCERHYDDHKNPGNLWTLTRAADLAALLTAYDQLARELGHPILFGH